MDGDIVFLIIISLITIILTIVATFAMLFTLKRKNRPYTENSVKAIREISETNNANLKIMERYYLLLKQEALQQGEAKILAEQFNKYIEETKQNAKKYDNQIEELIKTHHEQALNQSRIQFWFSLIVSIVGFIFILVMIFIKKEAQWYEYIVSVVPGTVMETVSVLFFSQSKATRERASDFLNRLREDRQYEKAIKIAETIDDKDLQATLKAEIALHLCGIDNINIFQHNKPNGTEIKNDAKTLE